MGSGKGSNGGVNIKPGRVLFELSGVGGDHHEAMRLAIHGVALQGTLHQVGSR